MAYFTVTGLAAAFDKLTVNTAFAVPELLSSTLTLAMETAGGETAVSSSVIVALAVPRAIVAPEGFDKVTVKRSLDSTVVSPITETEASFLVSPGLKVRVFGVVIAT